MKAKALNKAKPVRKIVSRKHTVKKKKQQQPIVAKKEDAPLRSTNLNKILERIQVIGAPLPERRHLKAWDLSHVPDVLNKLLAKEPESNIYLFFKIESGSRLNDVPVLTVASCKTAPTLLVTKRSTQTQSTDLTWMSDHHLKWTTLKENERVHFLQAVANIDDHDLNYMDLVLQKPSQIDSTEPEKVLSVSVSYMDVDVVWSLEDGTLNDCVQEIIEDESWAQDVASDLKSVLRSELQTARDLEYVNFTEKRGLYQEMVERLGSHAKDALEQMKLYKIYPQNDELEARTFDSFCGVQTGFIKNPDVNPGVKAEALF